VIYEVDDPRDEFDQLYGLGDSVDAVSGQPIDHLPSRRPTVAIVEDHVIVREGLELLVSRSGNWDLMWSGSDLEQLVSLGIVPDLVLLDLNINGQLASPWLVSTLVRRGARVLAVTGMPTRASISEAAAAGVTGFVSKGSGSAELANAMWSVVEGRSWMCAQIRMTMASASDLRTAVRLTPREQTTLAMYAKGFKVVTIARDLQISEHTVRHHLRSVREKLAAVGYPAPTQLELTRRAVELGVVDR
jgi:DNA-binding NarL/FixJ family response regulator